MTNLNEPISKLTLQRTINGENLVFISAGRQECSPTDSSGPNARSYEMIHFVIKGKAHFYFYGQHYLVEAGHCFYAPAFAATFYHADSIDPCTYAWINFTGDAAKDIVKNCGLSSISPVAPVKEINSIYNLISQLLRCYEPTKANDLAIQGFMRVILAMLMTNADTKESMEESPLDNDLVQQAVAYVQQHAAEQLSVQKLAEALFISRGYLHQLFAKYLRITPQQFITNYKVQTASELLIKTTMPISQIAKQCGYANQTAFSRAFTRELSLSPREYRRQFTHPDTLLTE